MACLDLRMILYSRVKLRAGQPENREPPRKLR